MLRARLLMPWLHLIGVPTVPQILRLCEKLAVYASCAVLARCLLRRLWFFLHI